MCETKERNVKWDKFLKDDEKKIIVSEHVDEELTKALGKIKWYEKRPQLIPFVGKGYHETEILLVGESHFVNGKVEISNTDMENWYEEIPDCFIENGELNTENFVTRRIVCNFVCGNSTGSHRIFGNPIKEYMKIIEDNDEYSYSKAKEKFVKFAFMNFFQKPSLKKGASIEDTKYDREYAEKNLREVILVLKPKKVIFLSQKAYKAAGGKKFAVGNVEIDFVSHPNSRHWEEDEENGREKFRTKIREHIYGKSE